MGLGVSPQPFSSLYTLCALRNRSESFYPFIKKQNNFSILQEVYVKNSHLKPNIEILCKFRDVIMPKCDSRILQAVKILTLIGFSIIIHFTSSSKYNHNINHNFFCLAFVADCKMKNCFRELLFLFFLTLVLS